MYSNHAPCDLFEKRLLLAPGTAAAALSLLEQMKHQQGKQHNKQYAKKSSHDLPPFASDPPSACVFTADGRTVKSMPTVASIIPQVRAFPKALLARAHYPHTSQTNTPAAPTAAAVNGTPIRPNSRNETS